MRGADPVEWVRVQSDSAALTGGGPDDEGVVPSAPDHQETGVSRRGTLEVAGLESSHYQL